MNIVICDAIRARRQLRFVYDGYERIVEPHAYGVNTAGHEAVSGWLAGGWSASEPEPGWRMFLVERMHDVAALSTPILEDVGADGSIHGIDIMRAIRSFDPCMPCAVHMDDGRRMITRDVTSCACGSDDA